MSDLPPWPEKPPIFHHPGDDDGGNFGGSCSLCHQYEQERADAALARLRLLVEKATTVVCEYRREFAPGELEDVDELDKPYRPSESCQSE